MTFDQANSEPEQVIALQHDPNAELRFPLKYNISS